MGSSRRWWLNHETHSRVAGSTVSRLLHDARRWIGSALCFPDALDAGHKAASRCARAGSRSGSRARAAYRRQADGAACSDRAKTRSRASGSRRPCAAHAPRAPRPECAAARSWSDLRADRHRVRAGATTWQQRPGRAADPGRDGPARRPRRLVVLLLGLQHHAHRAFDDLGENCGDFLLIAPSSQVKEPPVLKSRGAAGSLRAIISD